MSHYVQISGFVPAKRTPERTLRLIPPPQNLTQHEKAVQWPAPIPIQTNLPAKEHFLIEEFITEVGIIQGDEPEYEIKTIPPPKHQLSLAPHNAFKTMTLRDQDNYAREGYRLEFADGADTLIIAADNKAGIFYGLQTLLQICRSCKHPDDGSLIIPHITILDYPNMQLRGLSDDISRGQAPTVEGVKRFMKILSHVKVNHYFLYMEDTFKFEKYPSIGVTRGAFNKEQIAELHEYAQRHFMTLSPIFESLGHMDNILSLKEFWHLAEYPSSDCLDISNPDVYNFLEDLYRELGAAFPSVHFHIGCDESWELGMNRSRDYIDERGEKNVYIDHYQRLYDLAKAHGKEHIYLYHDFAVKHEEILKALPGDLIYVYWDYGARKKYKDLDKLVEAGCKTVVSSSTHDCRNYFPNMSDMENNAEQIIPYGYVRGAHGVIQSSWGDLRNYQPRENRIFGFAYASVHAWNISGFSRNEFWNHFLFHLYGGNQETADKTREILPFFRECFEDKMLNKKESFEHLWSHPFAWHTLKRYTKGYPEVLERVNKLIELSESIENQVIQNVLNAQTITMSLRIYRLFIMKRLAAQAAEDVKGTKVTHEKIEHVCQQLEEVAAEFQNMKVDYENLWKQTCSPDNLPPILCNFDWMSHFFTQKTEQLRQGIIWKNPNVPAEWIYYRPKRKKYDILTTHFRTDFTLEEGFRSVIIQLVCDTHAIVRLNGQKIEEVVSKRMTSLRMINSVIDLIDLTEWCRPGRNTLTITNMNYRGGYGIINVYGEITDKSGTTRVIKSDTSWRAMDSDHEGWINGEAPLQNEQDGVVTVKSLGAPPLVNGGLAYPILEKSIESHHTTMFGFISAQILPYIPSKILWLAKKVSLFATKRGWLI